MSVRSGGHNPNGYALNDGGLVIDLRLLNYVHIDPVARRARVGGGALAGDLVREAGDFGLVPVTGMLPDIGFAGLSLNGGVGYFTAKHGMACDNIVGATLVAATGDIVHCSEDERPELLWGLQGAGSNFGVVTEIEVALHELPETVHGGVITWRPDLDGLRGLLAALLTATQESSDGLYPAIVVSKDEKGDPRVMAVLCHVGPPEVAEVEIAAIRALAPSESDSVVPAAYFTAVIAIDKEIESNFADGLCRRWVDRELSTSPDHFAQVVAENFDKLVTEPSYDAEMTLTIEGKPLTNTLGTPARHRRSPGVSVKIGYRGAENAERFTPRVVDLDSALVEAGVATSEYGNLHSISDVTPEITAASFGVETYQRLAKLKADYDPDNVFHRNYNVLPSS